MPYIPKIHSDDANIEVRRAIQAAHLTHRQIAKAVEVSPATLSRRLNRELPDEQKAKMMKLIEMLSTDAD